MLTMTQDDKYNIRTRVFMNMRKKNMENITIRVHKENKNTNKETKRTHEYVKDIRRIYELENNGIIN